MGRELVGFNLHPANLYFHVVVKVLNGPFRSAKFGYGIGINRDERTKMTRKIGIREKVGFVRNSRYFPKSRFGPLCTQIEAF